MANDVKRFTMKKLLTASAILSSAFLFGCTSSDTEEKQKTDLYDGVYNASFEVIDGDCYDINGVRIVINDGKVFVEDDIVDSASGSVYVGGEFSMAATGDDIGTISINGKANYHSLEGTWSSGDCDGTMDAYYFRDVFSSEEEKYQ